MSVRYAPVFLALMPIFCTCLSLAKEKDDWVDWDDNWGWPQKKSGLTTMANGYYLAFRVQPGIHHQAYRTYTMRNRNDDNDVVKQFLPCGCTKTDKKLKCDRHFRSQILDYWKSLPIERVRIGVYKHNQEKAFFEFDGRGSSITSWFCRKRLVDSSYTDLKKSKTNYFSMKGHSQVLRRFFINANYGGCHVDRGWLMVGDNKGVCPWEKRLGNYYPRIFYSKRNCAGTYNKRHEVGLADSLIVSVKMKSQTCW